ncbi:hypothetical protein F2Q68_00009704 [Brassica cretica]|uniref:Uncharacterized protein n=1 Tax=Brassica cretica TaxID=69181 RepID=A0A3N6QF58_BRACR|nr:hypothetical protein F2Q68_00009704 [Brassica cretica]
MCVVSDCLNSIQSLQQIGSSLRRLGAACSIRKRSEAACIVKNHRIHCITLRPAGQPAKKCAIGGTGLGLLFGDRSPRGPDPP